MPRPKYCANAIYPYHVSARCINKEWFKVPLFEVWEIVGNNLFFISHAYKIKVHAFVLMSNHFHLLISTPEANLCEAMAYFMRESSRAIARCAGRINQTFGGRYHSSLITKESYFLNAYKYIYRNPVEAGLVPLVEDYEFSTLKGILGFSKLIIPVIEDTLLFECSNSVESHLLWLNHAPDPDHLDAVRKALRRREFQYGKDKNTNRLSHGENDIL